MFILILFFGTLLGLALWAHLRYRKRRSQNDKRHVTSNRKKYSNVTSNPFELLDFTDIKNPINDPFINRDFNSWNDDHWSLSLTNLSDPNNDPDRYWWDHDP